MGGQNRDLKPELYSTMHHTDLKLICSSPMHADYGSPPNVTHIISCDLHSPVLSFNVEKLGNEVRPGIISTQLGTTQTSIYRAANLEMTGVLIKRNGDIMLSWKYAC